MENQTGKCPICNSDQTTIRPDYNRDSIFYDCPLCGRFQLDVSAYAKRNIRINRLAPYLLHNAIHLKAGEKPRYHTTLSEEECAKHRESYDQGQNTHGYPIHMDQYVIDNWYPKTFSEKIDKILLYLNDKLEHFGESKQFSHTELEILFFIDRYETVFLGDSKLRDPSVCYQEAVKMLHYLKEERYVVYSTDLDGSVYLSIDPHGYSRIDEFQRYMSNGNDALVAMEFGEKTKSVREAIRKGIIAAGYNPIIYDEVENNDYIMPELLKSIRDSKFVVADLSDHNNGAYFEEGYAMGIGKPVIQLCRKGVELHFDAAQKNTIVLETESELSDRLTNRIKATID